MKIVFFGTSEFAMPSLHALIGSRHKVLAVITQTDKKKGRNLFVSPPPTKVLALTKEIPVFQPKDVSCEESVNYLRELDADLFVVISFGQILKKNVLAVPKFYSINLHGSLLPKYRGAAPTNWAVISGEKSSGVTIIRINEKMDEGDIITKREIPIEDQDTNITLNEKLSELGAGVLMETIDAIESGKGLKFENQDGAAATYAPKLKKEYGLIDWKEPPEKIHNKVRGLIPWPGAYTYYEGKILKVLQTEVPDNAVAVKDAEHGEVLEIAKGRGVIVRAGSGCIAVKYLQLEGKKVLDSDSFFRGHRIPVGYVLGK
ncbi:MAG: methionyl-tRNA formyltransferase [Candidatus Omnitrophica bacterium]|nr:methionyl-tRNA formyltransferase [Candidatus Omnitrophota bacterium]